MPEKMKISAVICELNPLHLGHRALLAQAKALSQGVVCVLSGNFVQRGEPAVLDKWDRCRLALENGADLVIELPLPWACAGAERFAAGGVALAQALGCVDFLVFGCEDPQLDRLQTLAGTLLSPVFSRQLALLEEDGRPFASRREQALAQLLGPEESALLGRPNNILAVEYLKALKREGSSISPVALKRQGAGHDRQARGCQFRSAGELRDLFRRDQALTGLAPENTLAALEKARREGRAPASLHLIERPVLCKLRTLELADFAALPDVSEGLEHRLYAASRQACSLEEFYSLVKSKRISHARIRRLAMGAFLGLTRFLPVRPPYLRILGRTDLGGEILRQAVPTLPLAARPADFQRLGGAALDLYRLEAQSSDLYALACPTPQPCGRDYRESLIKV